MVKSGHLKKLKPTVVISHRPKTSKYHSNRIAYRTLHITDYQDKY